MLLVPKLLGRTPSAPHLVRAASKLRAPCMTVLLIPSSPTAEHLGGFQVCIMTSNRTLGICGNVFSFQLSSSKAGSLQQELMASPLYSPIAQVPARLGPMLEACGGSSGGQLSVLLAHTCL